MKKKESARAHIQLCFLLKKKQAKKSNLKQYFNFIPKKINTYKLINFKRYALKLSNYFISNESELNEDQDVKNLRNLNHQNIIKYIEDFMFQSRICIVTKYYEVNLLLGCIK